MKNPVKLLSVVVVVCGLMVGCAPDWEARPTVFSYPDNMTDQQEAAVDDRKVTEEEYTAGFRAYQACLADAGYEIFAIARPSTVYDFAIPEAAVTSGADEECYDANFIAVDYFWQTANPPVTEWDSLARECLADEGLPTDGNINELKQRMYDNDIDVNRCFGLDEPDPESER